MKSKGASIGNSPSAYNGPPDRDKSQSFEQVRWSCWWWELG